jgi:hypothetical protein
MNDNPKNNTWSFSRPRKQPLGMNYWFMPHFSYWPWPLPFTGTMGDALARIARVEDTTPWENNIDKVVLPGFTQLEIRTCDKAFYRSLDRTRIVQMWGSLEWTSGGEEAENAIVIQDYTSLAPEDSATTTLAPRYF